MPFSKFMRPSSALARRPLRSKSLCKATLEIKTAGIVREVSPAVDPKSGTVKVKLGLTKTPPEMTLGAIVTGRARIGEREAIVLPWSAMFKWQEEPAVWILSADNRAYPRPVKIDSFATEELVLSGGVKPGEKVVTAGVQFLRPGQAVDVAE